MSEDCLWKIAMFPVGTPFSILNAEKQIKFGWVVGYGKSPDDELVFRVRYVDYPGAEVVLLHPALVERVDRCWDAEMGKPAEEPEDTFIPRIGRTNVEVLELAPGLPDPEAFYAYPDGLRPTGTTSPSTRQWLRANGWYYSQSVWRKRA